jgi:streptogramin lyase
VPAPSECLHIEIRPPCKDATAEASQLPAGLRIEEPDHVAAGRIWFTGQNNIYSRLNPTAGDMKIWDAPKGRGPYGITGTPKGNGSYLANVDLENGAATVYEPPTRDQGARRVWSDSKGRLWISEWNSGSVSVYDPIDKELEALEASRREAAHLRRVSRSRRQGVALRVGSQCDRAL